MFLNVDNLVFVYFFISIVWKMKLMSEILNSGGCFWCLNDKKLKFLFFCLYKNESLKESVEFWLWFV